VVWNGRLAAPARPRLTPKFLHARYDDFLCEARA
jgi:hypothetical protein